MIEVFRSFTFEAAHYLPNVPEAHKCHRMHGHSYEVTLTLASKSLDPKMGWLVDFGEIKRMWNMLCDRHLDHKVLNDVVPNPTAEMLAMWIYRQLQEALPALSCVEVKETRDAGARFRAA